MKESAILETSLKQFKGYITKAKIVTLAALIFVLASGNPVAAKQITLTYANYLSQNHITSVYDTQWCKEVEKETGGKVKFKYYYGGSLYKGPELLEALKTGTIDLANIAPGYNISSMPLAGGLQTVFLTEKPPVMIPVIQNLYKNFPPFKREFLQNGIVMIEPTVIPETWIYMGKNHPINSLADLKGKRIRAYGWLSNALALLGVDAVGITYNEIYPSMDRNVLDGFSGVSVEAVGASGLDEVSKYFVDIGLGYYASSFLCMNRDTWNKLPKDVQKVMERVSAQAMERWKICAAQLMRKYMPIYIQKGIKITRLPSNQIAEARQIGGKVHELWIKKQAPGIPARKFLTLVNHLINKYEPKIEYTSAWSIYNNLKKKK